MNIVAFKQPLMGIIVQCTIVPVAIHVLTLEWCPCFQSSALTSMDDHTFDHAVVDDYHTVCILYM